MAQASVHTDVPKAADETIFTTSEADKADAEALKQRMAAASAAAASTAPPSGTVSDKLAAFPAVELADGTCKYVLIRGTDSSTGS